MNRGGTYGDIDDNSATFAHMMHGVGITTPAEMTNTQFHCMSNISTKLARLATTNFVHEDSWLDLANYAILALASLQRSKHGK